eukprot:1870956-Rhodomonas_salina.2
MAPPGTRPAGRVSQGSITLGAPALATQTCLSCCLSLVRPGTLRPSTSQHTASNIENWRESEGCGEERASYTAG